MLRILLFSAILLSGFRSSAQSDTIRFMQYNLLMFPEANPNKAFNMKPITRYLQPDVIALNEITSITAFDLLISEGLDSNIYESAPYIWDTYLMNGLFYNKIKLGSLGARFLPTSPRRTCIYTLYYKAQDFSVYPDTLKFEVYLVHLKSSQGNENEDLRAAQTAAIRTDMNNQLGVINNLVAGDLNVYTSSEEAYQNLLASGNGQYFDPINRPGNWNNNTAFKDIHTQSPRTASFDNGVTGGLDDRFDFILATGDIISGSAGLRYIPGSYETVGNDGQHFNTSIIAQPENTSAPDSVIQALHAMSDHLIVIMDVEVIPENIFTGIPKQANYSCPVFIPGQQLFNPELYDSICLKDLAGRVVLEISDDNPYQRVELSPGIYLISTLQKDGKSCFSKIRVLEQ